MVEKKMKINEKKYKEIQTRYNRVKKYKDDPTAAVLMGRPVLESLLKLIYELEFKKEYFGSLEELIALLEDKKIFVGELEKKATRLRRTGNFANHGSDGDVPEKYSKEYVKDLGDIFNWFSSRYCLFTEAFNEDSLSEIIKFDDFEISLKDIQNLTPTVIFDDSGKGISYREAVNSFIINHDGTTELFMNPDMRMLITNKNLLINKDELIEGQHIEEHAYYYMITGTSSIVIYGNLRHNIHGIEFDYSLKADYLMIETPKRTYYLKDEKRNTLKLFLHLTGLYSQIKKKIEDYFTKEDYFTSEEIELSLATELGGWFAKKIFKKVTELDEEEVEEIYADFHLLYPEHEKLSVNSEEFKKASNDFGDYYYDRNKEEVDFLWKYYKRYYPSDGTTYYAFINSFDDVLINFEEDEIITRRRGRWYKY